MKEIQIIFTKAKQYKMIPVAGAWGGVSPQGDIIFDLFIDKIENPETLHLTVEQNAPPKEAKREGGDKYVRESQVGIIVRPDIAHSIGKWLLEKAREAGFKEGGPSHAH